MQASARTHTRGPLPLLRSLCFLRDKRTEGEPSTSLCRVPLPPQPGARRAAGPSRAGGASKSKVPLTETDLSAKFFCAGVATGGVPLRCAAAAFVFANEETKMDEDVIDDSNSSYVLGMRSGARLTARVKGDVDFVATVTDVLLKDGKPGAERWFRYGPLLVNLSQVDYVMLSEARP